MGWMAGGARAVVVVMRQRYVQADKVTGADGAARESVVTANRINVAPALEAAVAPAGKDLSRPLGPLSDRPFPVWLTK